MLVQKLHLHSAKDLKVELTLPEEFIGKDVRITITPVENLEERLANDPFFQYLDSLQIDTRGWKFNRDEANER